MQLLLSNVPLIYTYISTRARWRCAEFIDRYKLFDIILSSGCKLLGDAESFISTARAAHGSNDKLCPCVAAYHTPRPDVYVRAASTKNLGREKKRRRMRKKGKDVGIYIRVGLAAERSKGGEERKRHRDEEAETAEREIGQ